MAELATVARPYAEALFRVAQSGDMAAWSAVTAELGQIGANPDVQEFYLGGGGKVDYHNVKHYRRRKRWLA